MPSAAKREKSDRLTNSSKLGETERAEPPPAQRESLEDDALRGLGNQQVLPPAQFATHKQFQHNLAHQNDALRPDCGPCAGNMIRAQHRHDEDRVRKDGT